MGVSLHLPSSSAGFPLKPKNNLRVSAVISMPYLNTHSISIKSNVDKAFLIFSGSKTVKGIYALLGKTQVKPAQFIPCYCIMCFNKTDNKIPSPPLDNNVTATELPGHCLAPSSPS